MSLNQINFTGVGEMKFLVAGGGGENILILNVVVKHLRERLSIVVLSSP